MTSMAECILANEWWYSVTQDALRVDQLAADRKRDVRLPDSYGSDVGEWIWVKCDGAEGVWHRRRHNTAD